MKNKSESLKCAELSLIFVNEFRRALLETENKRVVENFQLFQEKVDRATNELIKAMKEKETK